MAGATVTVQTADFSITFGDAFSVGYVQQGGISNFFDSEAANLCKADVDNALNLECMLLLRSGTSFSMGTPELIAGPGWQDHVEGFVQKLSNINGVRLPGARRHKNRMDKGPRPINSALIETINGLL